MKKRLLPAALFASAAISSCGHSGAEEQRSSAILCNRALEALRAGEISQAEAWLREVKPGGDRSIEGQAEFLRGNAAYARAEIAQAQALGPEAEPFALDVAIAQFDAAGLFWQRAAARAPDWPSARRNAERAWRRAAELRQRKESSKPKTQSATAPPSVQSSPPEPSSEDRPKDKRLEEEARLDLSWEDAPVRDIASLFETIERREKEKRALRRAQRQARRFDVEKDW